MGLLFLSSFITIILSLNQGEDPVESDIIVVLQGSTNFERERVAVSLLSEGYSKSNKIIVSPLTSTDHTIYSEREVLDNQIIDEDKLLLPIRMQPIH